MNLKVNNLFAQPKTLEGLNEMLDDLFGSVTLERANAELIKGLTVNLIAHMYSTACENCEVTRPIYCKPCVDMFHNGRYFEWSREDMGPRDPSVDAALKEKELI